MRYFFIFLFYSQLLPAQVWVQLTDFPGIKRDDGVAVIVNGKAYFGTGLIEWALTTDFYSLDLGNLSWSSVPAMPNSSERQYACAFAGPNCFFVFGGEGPNGPLSNMYKFDIASNAWTAVASKPGNGLIASSCMSFGNKVIIAGGKFQSGGQVSNEVWEYTINTDSWAQKNSFPFLGRWRASAAVLNNSGYLLFGRDTSGSYRKELYKYNSSTDAWTKIMDFPLPMGRAYAALNVANNKLFMFGGQDTLEHYYKDLWYFNEMSASWLQGPDIPALGRKGGMSCAYGGMFYYSCGIGEGPARLTETWMTDIPLGIKEYDYTSSFSVYPNPTNGIIYMEQSNPNKKFNSLTCSYTDISGRELGRSKSIDLEKPLDLGDLNTGIYFLKIYSGNELIEVKQIIRN
jgi:hypothetical protein